MKKLLVYIMLIVHVTIICSIILSPLLWIYISFDYFWKSLVALILILLSSVYASHNILDILKINNGGKKE